MRGAGLDSKLESKSRQDRCCKGSTFFAKAKPIHPVIASETGFAFHPFLSKEIEPP